MEGGDEGAEEGGGIVNYTTTCLVAGQQCRMRRARARGSGQSGSHRKCSKLNGVTLRRDYLIDSIVLYPGSMMGDGAAIPIEFTYEQRKYGSSAVQWRGLEPVHHIECRLATELGATSYAGVGGGCFLIAEGAIISDITQYYSGQEETIANFPTAFPYENSGDTFRFCSLSIEDILSSLEDEPDILAIATPFWSMIWKGSDSEKA